MGREFHVWSSGRKFGTGGGSLPTPVGAGSLCLFTARNLDTQTAVRNRERFLAIYSASQNTYLQKISFSGNHKMLPGVCLYSITVRCIGVR
jgi:hypothetical protein